MDINKLRQELIEAEEDMLWAERRANKLRSQLIRATAVGWVSFGGCVCPVSPERDLEDYRVWGMIKFGVRNGVPLILICDYEDESCPYENAELIVGRCRYLKNAYPTNYHFFATREEALIYSSSYDSDEEGY